MSAWFYKVGEPLGADERARSRCYLRGLGIEEELSIESVSDWDSAGAAIRAVDWDRRWWDAEQRERQRLNAAARGITGETHFLRWLTARMEQSLEAVYEAAVTEASRRGCTDAALIRAAAGAAGEALHLYELAELAGQSREHPFQAKQALFAAGHWPLGIVSGSYRIF
jgi:hypothetical protein